MAEQVLDEFYRAVAAAAEIVGTLDKAWLYSGASPIEVRKAVLARKELHVPYLAFGLATGLYGTKAVQSGEIKAAKRSKFSEEAQSVIRTAAKYLKTFSEGLTGTSISIAALVSSAVELGIIVKALQSAAPTPALPSGVSCQ